MQASILIHLDFLSIYSFWYVDGDIFDSFNPYSPGFSIYFEETIYYTREQKKELFINLEEQGYTKEELSELDKYMKVHIYTKEEYFANCKPFEFRGGTEWETMEEWFEDVEYQFKEVA